MAAGNGERDTSEGGGGGGGEIVALGSKIGNRAKFAGGQHEEATGIRDGKD